MTIKDFLYVITIKTLIVAAAAVGATIYCIENEFVTEIPISLIGLAVVFPLVFTIGTAFQRRDLALKEYGAINSNFASIFFIAKNWQLDDKENTCDLDSLKKTIGALFDLIKEDLQDQKSTNLIKQEIYTNFEELYKLTSKIKAPIMIDSTDPVVIKSSLLLHDDKRDNVNPKNKNFFIKKEGIIPLF